MQEQHFMKVEVELRQHAADIHDVREATALLAQWSKKDQKDEADRQIKLMGWKGESRPERRQ
eukprot:2161179-Alexandrium_andersonii.AAC.1